MPGLPLVYQFDRQYVVDLENDELYPKVVRGELEKKVAYLV